MGRMGRSIRAPAASVAGERGRMEAGEAYALRLDAAKAAHRPGR